MTPSNEVTIVGSGPNGLAAALVLARAGLGVTVYGAKETVGGGTRTQELTLPGFLHDLCSAVHPLGVASPFFNSLPLKANGVEWVTPATSVAHPLDGGKAVALHRDMERTAEGLGMDGARYRWLVESLLAAGPALIADLLAPLHLPRSMGGYARFGTVGVLPARLAAERLLQTHEARALFAGMAAHGMLPLERSPSAAFGLMLMLLGNGSGWPIARGGSQTITQALARLLLQAGGRIETGVEVRSSRQLAGARLVLFDTTPNQMVRIMGDRLSTVYRNAVARFRHNPGVFKIDWALREPIPWSNRFCGETATVHIGGTLEEVAAAERDVWAGRHPRRPFVLLAQASLFDSSRAPAGKHTGWGYCHVPGGSVVDMTDAIEAQVERFAPGFREIVLARHTFNTVEMEAYNPNYVGGDINGGVQDMWQHFTRPIRSALPYRTSTPGIYLCSASTPPGGGVHGMCGYHAAHVALNDLDRGRA